MERAIEFLLKNQATHDERISRTQAQIGEMQTQLSKTQTQLAQTVESINELNCVVQMQAESQGQLNQILTTAITNLAEAQTKTERKVDRLTGIVETLVERLSP